MCTLIFALLFLHTLTLTCLGKCNYMLLIVCVCEHLRVWSVCTDCRFCILSYFINVLHGTIKATDLPTNTVAHLRLEMIKISSWKTWFWSHLSSKTITGNRLSYRPTDQKIDLWKQINITNVQEDERHFDSCFLTTKMPKNARKWYMGYQDKLTDLKNLTSFTKWVKK